MDRFTSILLLGVGVLVGALTAVAWTNQGASQAGPDVSDAAPMQDSRTMIDFAREEREHIRSEMLAFLNGTQSITYGLAEQDRILIADAARELSRGAGNPISASIRAKAPEGFVNLSRSLRRDFGELAMLSETADFADLQLQFSVTMSRCVACHGTYRSAGDGP